MNRSPYVLLTGLALILGACSQNRQFSKGEYDNPDEVRLLDDKFNEADVSQFATEMVNSMAQHPIFVDAKLPPVVQVEEVRNQTSEHVNTKTITDSIRTALIKTGRVRFSNKEDRETAHGEVDYQQESGRVRRDTQKKRNGGVGADYILTGDLVSNTQEVGSRKLVYYKLTLNLTNLTTNLIEWSEEKPIRKRFKKRTVGM